MRQSLFGLGCIVLGAVLMYGWVAYHDGSSVGSETVRTKPTVIVEAPSVPEPGAVEVVVTERTVSQPRTDRSVGDVLNPAEKSARTVVVPDVYDPSRSASTRENRRVVADPERVIKVPAVAPPKPSVIFAGLLDIPRHPMTGPTDGCAKVQKGLIHSGGFLVFTCEKLLPQHDISQHARVFQDYHQALLAAGWQSRPAEEPAENKITLIKSDRRGCDMHLDMSLWTDRSMNEPRREATDRNAHRQIMFMSKFYGEACERHYKTAENLAARPRRR